MDHHQFADEVAERAGVDRGTADIGVAAVFATLRDTISSDEYRVTLTGDIHAVDRAVAHVNHR